MPRQTRATNGHVGNPKLFRIFVTAETDKRRLQFRCVNVNGYEILMCVFNVHHFSARDSLICFYIQANFAFIAFVAYLEFQSRFSYRYNNSY